jgi:membrane AbrB-like protein
VLFLATLGVASATGLLAKRLHLPGGLLVGAMVGAAAVTVISGTDSDVPIALRTTVPLAVGVITGVLITPELLRGLHRMVMPAVASAAVMIAAGIGIAVAMKALGVEPPAAVLATSPGALSVLTTTAIEIRTGEVEVALFHTVRLVLVVLLAPVLLLLLPRRPGQET